MNFKLKQYKKFYHGFPREKLDDYTRSIGRFLQRRLRRWESSGGFLCISSNRKNPGKSSEIGPILLFPTCKPDKLYCVSYTVMYYRLILDLNSRFDWGWKVNYLVSVRLVYSLALNIILMHLIFACFICISEPCTQWYKCVLGHMNP